MEDKNKTEELRIKLYEAIEKYGRESPKALKISQELDKLIVKDMKKKLNKQQCNYKKNKCL
ncbi:Spo0E like sporulation regulatory protein [Clostridium puniceum]|uniref:Spo0E like sporulation regulatory protein n=1 Tax=Clostridium puniceum TaxID=29367 RepID=A0A1S8TK28_9CLOT|nr:aspartyl-phosphate phosphatase Spo0E family protein [Clostridium puniceum]OOM78137.1 Spo0E like sporulation regulatory protein [Clostridium puniceum]